MVLSPQTQISWAFVSLFCSIIQEKKQIQSQFPQILFPASYTAQNQPHEPAIVQHRAKLHTTEMQRCSPQPSFRHTRDSVCIHMPKFRAERSVVPEVSIMEKTEKPHPSLLPLPPRSLLCCGPFLHQHTLTWILSTTSVLPQLQSATFQSKHILHQHASWVQHISFFMSLYTSHLFIWLNLTHSPRKTPALFKKPRLVPCSWAYKTVFVLP